MYCVISSPVGGITGISEGGSKGERTGRAICAGCPMSPGISVEALESFPNAVQI